MNERFPLHKVNEKKYHLGRGPWLETWLMLALSVDTYKTEKHSSEPPEGGGRTIMYSIKSCNRENM